MVQQTIYFFKVATITTILMIVMACNNTSPDPTNNTTTSGPVSVIKSDTHLNPIAVGEKLVITSVHTNVNKIGKVEFYVDNNLIDTQTPPFAQTIFSVEHTWIPPLEKVYEIKILAYAADDLNNSASQVATIVEAAGSLIPLATQVINASPEPTQPLGDQIACLNDANLVADITIPDGSQIEPNAIFDKTWRVKNTGTCIWGTGYYFDLTDGPPLGATQLNIGEVFAGEEYDLTLKMTAPVQGGTYRSEWRLFDPQNRPFGQIFFVEFVVPQRCQPPIINTFEANPSTITTGQQSVISWDVIGADTLTITPLPQITLLQANQTVSPTVTTVYALEAKDSDCITTRQITVTVTTGE